MSERKRGQEKELEMSEQQPEMDQETAERTGVIPKKDQKEKKK